MYTTIEAEVDEKGNIRPKEPVSLVPGSRVLITVLEPEGVDTALLSEPSLAADWQRPEEDAAWPVVPIRCRRARVTRWRRASSMGRRTRRLRVGRR